MRVSAACFLGKETARNTLCAEKTVSRLLTLNKAKRACPGEAERGVCQVMGHAVKNPEANMTPKSHLPKGRRNKRFFGRS